MNTLFSPIGSMGSLVYSQYGNLPLLQLLSITGLSGIVFIMTWFASIVNRAWEEQCIWLRVRKEVLLYAFLLVLIALGTVFAKYQRPTPEAVPDEAIPQLVLQAEN